MKIYHVFLLALCIFCGGCVVPDGEDSLVLEFPGIPDAWTGLLGVPRWLVRYYSADGTERSLESSDGQPVEIALSPSRISPVFAWPYWPERGVKPGDFRPAGAILPYEASLSWQGGVEAWFYQALNRAALLRAAGASGAAGLRRAENFNWPGFRDLFSDPAVSQAFRSDPWRGDWDAIAEKTIRSGFRKQWLVPAETIPLALPVDPGPWISPSPFPPPLLFVATPVFDVFPGPVSRSWYSTTGILHAAGTAWMLLAW